MLRHNMDTGVHQSYCTWENRHDSRQCASTRGHGGNLSIISLSLNKNITVTEAEQHQHFTDFSRQSVSFYDFSRVISSYFTYPACEKSIQWGDYNPRRASHE